MGGANIVVYITSRVHTVQLKDNLTHADRANTIYWLKAHSFINPYWDVWEGKSIKINFEKARMRVNKALSGYLHGYIMILFSVYVHTCIATYLASFLLLHCVQLDNLYCHT